MKKLLFIIGLFNFFLVVANHKNVILVGPPGVGKGTLANFLKEKFGYYHIAGGDIIRRHIKEGTDLGKQFQQFIANADPVPAQFAHDYINKPEMDKALTLNKPFIVDGFILSVEHKDVLVRYLKEKNILDQTCVIYLDAPDSVVLERVQARMICPQCQKNFCNTISICNVCDVSLIARDDQKIIKQRLSKYHLNIEPVIKKLHEDFRVIYLNTQFSIEQLEQKYTEILHQGIIVHE